MKEIKKWLDLQRFAGEGAGDGGGEGASTGDNAAAAEQNRLLELGVPAEKVARYNKARARRAAANPSNSAVKSAEQPKEEPQNSQQAAAATVTEEAPETEPTAKKTFKELMEDPDYNKEMQATVKARLKEAGTAQENLTKLAPVMELLARKYGLDAENLDYDALVKAASEDQSYYEEKALELGVPVEAAMRIDQQERDTARKKKEAERTLEQEKIRNHLLKLEHQGEILKKTFKNFDLRTELQNPVFARLTHPSVGLSVEGAYHAVHRREIQEATAKATAQRTAQQISNNIRAGQNRPDESGTSSKAASVTSFDYSKLSREEREAIKARVRRGEKVYLGR